MNEERDLEKEAEDYHKNRKICPLMSDGEHEIDCMINHCGWWSKDYKRCAILSIR